MKRYVSAALFILAVFLCYYFYPALNAFLHSQMAQASAEQKERDDAQAQADEFVESMNSQMLPPDPLPYLQSILTLLTIALDHVLMCGYIVFTWHAVIPLVISTHSMKIMQSLLKI